jgi:hypothetical protein
MKRAVRLRSAVKLPLNARQDYGEGPKRGMLCLS